MLTKIRGFGRLCGADLGADGDSGRTGGPSGGLGKTGMEREQSEVAEMFQMFPMSHLMCETGPPLQLDKDCV